MRERLLAAAVALTLTTALAPRAFAQKPASAPVAPATDTTPFPLPNAPTNAPSVDDPQLAPPPDAPRALASWDEALSLVRSQSPDFLTAYDNVLRAEAQARVALAGVLPTINAQGSYTHNFFTEQVATGIGNQTVAYPPKDALGVTGTLTWSVLDLHAIHAYGTAKRNVAATQTDLVEKRRDLAQSLVATMLSTLSAARVAELNRVGLRAALERLALAQAKTRIGGGTELDVDRARQDVAAARALVITGDETLRQTREALGVALGSRVPIAGPGNLDLDRFESTVAATCHLNPDLERRADVVAARKRIEIAERTADEVKLQYLPSIVLGSQIVWTNQPFETPDTTWNLQGLLNVPIWDGGARYGQLRDAEAAADQARQALTTVRLNELVQVEQATRAIEVARASRDVARDERDLAARVDERTRQGYLHGLGTSLDLVVSAQALRQAEINLVLLEFQTAQARALAVLANAECAY